MLFKHSLNVNITPSTIVSNYGSEELQTAYFLENGENVSISFTTKCISKLDELITVLQNIRDILAFQRAKELEAESKLLQKEPVDCTYSKSNGSKNSESFSRIVD
ncbi:hypothetical protein [Chroococcidiopsis thermalis]|uniref:Uncharacterized protein n=1 Tax=Chroococcidiopsis thermalis (strain PCC 7203) TaxID=251229 RepID=K9U8T9_CHRTP|nr:hypothetical protein [Chroococcidiopsis thermalis]AFY91240.1 hypothetical protein Chro_5905 [Chroococcidiopsis thermalis PCC 7203]